MMNDKAISGDLKLKVSDLEFNNDKESSNNPLSLGIQSGYLTLFDKNGRKITGIKGIEISNHVEEMVEVKVSLFVGCDFFISDLIENDDAGSDE